jgi:hypothetical protein
MQSFSGLCQAFQSLGDVFHSGFCELSRFLGYFTLICNAFKISPDLPDFMKSFSFSMQGFPVLHKAFQFSDDAFHFLYMALFVFVRIYSFHEKAFQFLCKAFQGVYAILLRLYTSTELLK